MATNWRELIVTNVDGETETLGQLAEDSTWALEGLVFRDGRIAVWPDFFVSAPGETPDWDTPHGEVDWTGFEKHVRARGSEGADNTQTPEHTIHIENIPQHEQLGKNTYCGLSRASVLSVTHQRAHQLILTKDTDAPLICQSCRKIAGGLGDAESLFNSGKHD